LVDKVSRKHDLTETKILLEVLSRLLYFESPFSFSLAVAENPSRTVRLVSKHFGTISNVWYPTFWDPLTSSLLERTHVLVQILKIFFEVMHRSHTVSSPWSTV